MTAPIVAAAVGGEASRNRGAVLALAMVLIWLAGVGFYIAFTGGFGDNPSDMLDTLVAKIKGGGA